MIRNVSLAALILATAAGASASSLDLGMNNAGVSFGNSPEWTGFRFNLVDEDVREVHGFNFTFWKPEENRDFAMHGVALGLVAPAVDGMDGIAVGGVAVACGELHGIAVAPVGVAASDCHGIAVGLVGVGMNDLNGIAVGGIGVGGDNMNGIAVGGIGVGGDRLRGVFAGGIGVGGDDLTGIFAGGVGVGGDRLRGVFAGGIGVGGDDMEGVFVSPGVVGGDRISGIALAGLYHRPKESFTGFGTGALTRADGDMNGISIAVVNIAHRLRGVQLGLVNYAANNPAWARFLPVMNVHLD